MNAIQFRFQECSIFGDGEFRSRGGVDGMAEIHIGHDGDWQVTALWIDCHNGKRGPAAQGKTIEVSRAYQGALWQALVESLERYHSDEIEDAINDAVSSWRSEPSRMTLQRAS